MKNLSWKTLVLGTAVLGGLENLTSAQAENILEDYFWLESPAIAEPGSRHFNVGALVGFNIKAQFTMSGSFSFANPKDPGATGTPGVNHEYDDGYVRVDATDNDQGATYYWGYQNAAQYDAGANRLYFHSSSAYTPAANSGNVTADAQLGFDTAYGGHLFRAGPALIGWELGFGFLPIKIDESFSSPATVNQDVYWYDTSNLGPAFFGTTPNILTSYDGTAAGPGAKLSDMANFGGTINNIPGTLVGTRTLDVTLYNFRLGPTLHWELGKRFAVALSAGGAMGFITGDLEFNETLVLSGSSPNNRGSFSDSELVYGGYVAGKLIFHAVNNGDFYLGAQYMPLGSTTFSGGGRTAKLDLSGGVYISVGINWPF